MNIIREARGTNISKQAQQIFLCCVDQDFIQRDILVRELLSPDAGVDCVVSWIEPNNDIDEALLRNELQEAQLLVIWVTVEFLTSIKDGVFPIEYRIAQEQKLPVLPIAADGGLFPPLTEKIGAIHGIARTDPEYREKLKKQLETFLASDELMRQIKEKAFTAELFLSYRKMDINEARRFMKVFHDIDGFESVSIWYDNFLEAGRIFDDEIKESIRKSDAFVLLVTPNLLKKNAFGEDNYVQSTEYPFARENNKPILPTEIIQTDKNQFNALFPDAGSFINIENTETMREAFSNVCEISLPNQDVERFYLLGMAYLKGFGVEKDVVRAIRLLENCTKNNDALALKAIRQLSDIYKDGICLDVDYISALRWERLNVSVTEKLYGLKNIEETAVAYGNLGVVYEKNSEYDKALEWFKKALEIYQETDCTHPKIAVSYNNIGTAYLRQGEYDQALNWHLKSVELCETLGEENLIVSAAYNNTGLNYEELGEYSKALVWFQKALSVNKKIFGQEHASTATVCHNIGMVYNKTGEYEKSLEWNEKALEIRRKFGENHPDVAISYNSIASVYVDKGEYDKALEWFRKALEIRERIFGNEHLATSELYNNMALVYSRKEEYDQALEWYRKALSVIEKTMGKEKSETAAVYNNIAVVYVNQGNYQKALEELQKALIIREKVFGEEHPENNHTYNNIAVVYDRRGEYSKALEWYKKALAVCEKNFGTEHPNIAMICNNIALVYYDMKNYQEALKWLEKALPIDEAFLGIEHPDTIGVRNNIADVKHKISSKPAVKQWWINKK